MATIAVTKMGFDELIASHDIVLVDFWAAWCGPCRMFAPTFEEASKRYGDVVFAKVDTETERELAARFEILSIPTLMVFRDQVLVYAQPGALPSAALEELIVKVKALDMDKMRQKLSEATDERSAAQGAG